MFYTSSLLKYYNLYFDNYQNAMYLTTVVPGNGHRLWIYRLIKVISRKVICIYIYARFYQRNRQIVTLFALAQPLKTTIRI